MVPISKELVGQSTFQKCLVVEQSALCLLFFGALLVEFRCPAGTVGMPPQVLVLFTLLTFREVGILRDQRSRGARWGQIVIGLPVILICDDGNALWFLLVMETWRQSLYGN